MKFYDIENWADYEEEIAKAWTEIHEAEEAAKEKAE